MQRLKTAFLLVILTVSCNKPFNDVPTETVTFSATFAESIHTRVSVATDAKNYCWTPGDRISIIFGTDAVESEFISDAPSDTASFKVNKTWSAEDFDNYRAIYPASSVIGCSKDAISVSLPSIQHYVSGSFDREACVLAAVTGSKGDYNLKFRSVCGFIKVPVFSVGDAAIKKISICGNGGEIVAGAASIEAAPGKGPVIVMESLGIPDSLSVAGEDFSSDAGLWETKTSGNAAGCPTRIELSCGEGVPIDSESTEFIFAVPPVAFPKGITICVTDVLGGEQVVVLNDSLSITRNVFTVLNPIQHEQSGGGLDLNCLSFVTPDGVEYVGTISENYLVESYIPAGIDLSNLILKFKTNGSKIFLNDVLQEAGVTKNDLSGRVAVIRVENTQGKSREYSVRILDHQYKISCWGDSLTHSSYNESSPVPISYPPMLRDMLGPTWDLFDGGNSGENTAEIGARQGAFKPRIKLTSGSVSSIYLDSPLVPDNAFRCTRWKLGLDQPPRGLNPATVNGVECMVAYNSITPVVPGAPLTLKDGDEIVTYAASHYRDVDVLVIYMGAGGGFSSIDNLIEQIEAMVDFTLKKQFIVMTHHNSKGFHLQGTDTEYISKMNEAFGEHVLHLREEGNKRAEEFLLRTGVISDVSEISETDRKYIDNGDWPLSFMRSESDAHFTREGSMVVATLVMEKMVKLGYLTK